MKTRLIVSLLLACSAPAQEKVTLTFIWHAGDRAELFRNIAREYTEQTGVEINAILPPLGNEWYERMAGEFARRGSGFDLCMFDSQNMSEFASQGHVVRLNDWLKNSKSISVSDFDAAALRRYAEYPEDSGNIYALPINQDCMGLVYRQDLFDNPEEKAAFRKKFGYELNVPQTYEQLRDIASFFTRPEQNLYGIAMYGSEDYDGCTSVFNNILWSFGAELWDAKSGKVDGYLNSPQAKQALEFYKDLFRYAPPGSVDAYVPEVDRAVKAGQVALAIQWYYFFDELYAQTVKPARLGFAPLPGQARRVVMVGGQGVSISRYSRHPEEAWRFLEWFMSLPQQWKWVEGGGKTGASAILNDAKFQRASPANPHFARSMSMTKDYWHLPEYPALLAAMQKHVHQAITDKVSPEEALDACAREHETILTKAKR